MSRPRGWRNSSCHSPGKGLDDLGSPPTERDLKKAKDANFLVLLLHGKNFSVNVEYQQAARLLCMKPWARRGERFLRTPRRWFLLKPAGLQPRFLGSPSMPPSFAERGRMPPGEYFPAGIPHPSLSPQGNPGEEKLRVGKRVSKSGSLSEEDFYGR